MGECFIMEAMRADICIKGKTVYLRAITEEDTDMVIRWRNSEFVVKNFIYRKEITRDEHLQWYRNKIKKGLVHQFIICRIEDDTPIGSAYLQNFEELNRKAEVGIFLDSSCAPQKGSGTEAMALTVRYGFEELKMHKIVARVLAYNIASRKMLERTGFVEEGYLKDELFIDGKYEDLVFASVFEP